MFNSRWGVIFLFFDMVLRSVFMCLMSMHFIITMDRLFGMDLNVVILLRLFMLCSRVMSRSYMSWFVVGEGGFLWLFLLYGLMLDLFHHDLVMYGSFHRTSKVCGLTKLVSTLANLLILSLDCLTGFLFEIDSDLVIDERDYHAIVERNKGRRLVVLHLRLALHENKSSI